MTTYYLLQNYRWGRENSLRLVPEAELFDCVYAEYLKYEPIAIRDNWVLRTVEQQYREFTEAVQARDGVRLAQALDLDPVALEPMSYAIRGDYPLRTFPPLVVTPWSRREREDKIAAPEQPSFDCVICAQEVAHRRREPLAKYLSLYAFSTEEYLKEHQRTNAHKRAAWVYREALHCVQVDHHAKIWLDKKGFQLEYLRAPMFYGEHLFTPVKDLIEALRDWRRGHGKPPEDDEAVWVFPKRDISDLWRRALHLQKNPR